MKGLTAEIRLKDGKFELVSGKEKVAANVRTFLRYHDWFRSYLPGFCIQLVPYVQKPVNYVLGLRTLMLGRISKAFSEYLPYTKVGKMSMRISAAKNVEIVTEYSVTFSEDSPVTQIEFLAP